MEGKRKPSVYSVTQHVVYKLSQTLKTSGGKANLANLRNSIGREYSQTLSIWPLLFESMPEEFLSRTGELTSQEKAIITALQLYALQQQGKTTSILLDEEEHRWDNLGHALSILHRGDNATAMDARFNAMITSSTFEELSHHLRQMIKLSKKKDVRINYARLAKDLHDFLKGKQENVRIRWAQAYYSTKEKGEENNEN